MKKLRRLLLALFIVATVFSLVGCGADSRKLTYVDLVNNSSGFTVENADVSIAVGLKKGNPLTDKINSVLREITTSEREEIMRAMTTIQNDEKSSFSPRYDFSDVSNGTLVVGMECGYEPFNWTQNDSSNGALPIDGIDGKYANGYDVQIAAMVASKMNMSVKIKQYEWGGLIPAVQSGALDLIIAGMSPTEERKSQIDFSDAYYSSNLVIVTREGSSLDGATTLSELDRSGVKIAAQPGTFHLDALKAQTSNLEVVSSLSDFVDMRIALEAGTIDGYVAEKPTAIAVCASSISENEGFFESVAYVWSTYWKDFLNGVANTLAISLVATFFGLLIGLAIGAVRTTPRSRKKPIAALQRIIDFILAGYVEVFRGTPMMVQSMVIYWGYAFATGGKTLNLFLSAVIIVSINTGAYVAEIARGGILSIDKGQFEGAKSLGMNHFQTMTRVVFPQVLRSILPAVSNEFVINVKDTSVLNVIGVTELFFFSNVVVKQTYRNFPTYFICCAIYFVLTFAITRILRLIEKLLDGKDSYVICGSQSDSAAMIKVKKEEIPND